MVADAGQDSTQSPPRPPLRPCEGEQEKENFFHVIVVCDE